MGSSFLKCNKLLQCLSIPAILQVTSLFCTLTLRNRVFTSLIKLPFILFLFLYPDVCKHNQFLRVQLINYNNLLLVNRQSIK